MNKMLLGGLATFALFTLLITGASAQFVGDYCNIGTVDIENSIVTAGARTKLSYDFTCSGAPSYSGQITKMLVRVPFTGIDNLKASDPYGTLDVLEGPKYVGKTESETEAAIGVIFRKGLIIENQTNTYRITLEFDTTSIISVSEDGLAAIKPGGLGATPRITIISKGVTETTIPLENINYELSLPEASSIQKTTKGCNIDGGEVICSGLTPEELNEVEVRWTGASKKIDLPFREIIDKLVDKGRDSAPSIFDIVKNIVGKGIEKISEN